MTVSEIESLINKKDTNKANDETLKENLIGQFGVGFYSAFIVADTVEVFSRKEGDSKVNVWISDNSGQYELGETSEEEFNQPRGTKIIIHLREEHRIFSEMAEIKKTIEKYSNFVQFPIKLNGEIVNTVQAIWSRQPSDISPEEYLNFFEHVSSSKDPYQFKLHYSVEVPLNIKALLYIPSKNKEAMNFYEDTNSVDLYSRKILISKNCKELLPNYLRFVKGVVDCEDLPLNISRENYQDTNLMIKLKSLLTKRVLRLLQEKAKRDKEEYKVFYNNYNMNIKEGLHSDEANIKILLTLIRFDSNIGNFISLEEYVKNMKEGQKNIYFFLAGTKDQAENSAYMEPFKKYDIPVLYLTINVEEVILQKLGQFEGFNFTNIESPNLSIPEQLTKDSDSEIVSQFKLPEEDRQNFCLWARNELQPLVTNAVISTKLVESPVMVTSLMSTGMRQMMSMMDQNFQLEQFSQNLTMEINPTHESIYKLNELRKKNVGLANNLLRHLLDNSMMNAGIYFDPKTYMKRMNLFITKLTDFELGNIQIDSSQNEAEEAEELPLDEIIEPETNFRSNSDVLADALNNFEQNVSEEKKNDSSN